MLSDRWDVAHICIAVDDLDTGMARYTEAFGLEWGPILDYSAEGLVLSPTHTMPMATCAPGHSEFSLEGLREVWSVNGGTPTPSGLPVAPLELAHARDFSPAHTIWGCPHGGEFVHHIAYWVDDIEAESMKLIEKGWRVEFTAPPGDRLRGFGYVRSPGGIRIELEDIRRKEPIAKWFRTGMLDLGDAAPPAS